MNPKNLSHKTESLNPDEQTLLDAIVVVWEKIMQKFEANPTTSNEKKLVGIFLLNTVALILGIIAEVYTPDITTTLQIAGGGLVIGVLAGILGKKAKMEPQLALMGAAVCLIVITLKLSQPLLDRIF